MNPVNLIDWSCPAVGGGHHDEFALVTDRRRSHRLLVLPAWFDEANKLRRQTVEVLRRLDLSGIDSMLPDLPGCNESEQSLAEQTLASWRLAAEAACQTFSATHVLTLRAGALIRPAGLPGWDYAPVAGDKVLRGMIRARTIAAREAGRVERTEELQAEGRRSGLELAGWRLGAAMFAEMESATPTAGATVVKQEDVGGAPLWRRAEPDEDPEQADALAAMIAIGLQGA